MVVHVKPALAFFARAGLPPWPHPSLSPQPRPGGASRPHNLPLSAPGTAHMPRPSARAAHNMSEAAPRPSGSGSRPVSQESSTEASLRRVVFKATVASAKSVIDLSRDGEDSPPRKVARIDERKSVPRASNRTKTRPATRAAEVIEVSDDESTGRVAVSRKRKAPSGIKQEPKAKRVEFVRIFEDVGRLRDAEPVTRNRVSRVKLCNGRRAKRRRSRQRQQRPSKPSTPSVNIPRTSLHIVHVIFQELQVAYTTVNERHKVRGSIQPLCAPALHLTRRLSSVPSRNKLHVRYAN